VNAIIWSLMCASAGAAMVALCAFGARGLIHRYPALSLTLLGSFLISTVLLWTKFDGLGLQVYTARWLAAQPIVAALHLAVTIEAFVHVCLHFSAIRRFGAALAGIFAGVSVACTYLLAGIGNPGWQHFMARFSRLLRNESLGCLLFLLLTVLFFVQFPFQDIPRNLRRHLFILGSLFVCLFAANLLLEAGSAEYGYAVAYQIIVTAGPAACYLAWAFGMTADGETWGRLGFSTAGIHSPPV
jgi:hypothetical protein